MRLRHDWLTLFPSRGPCSAAASRCFSQARRWSSYKTKPRSKNSVREHNRPPVHHQLRRHPAGEVAFVYPTRRVHLPVAVCAGRRRIPGLLATKLRRDRREGIVLLIGGIRKQEDKARRDSSCMRLGTQRSEETYDDVLQCSCRPVDLDDICSQ